MTTVSAQKSNKPLIEVFNQTRTRTLELVQNLEKDDFIVQTADYMSPPKWHLGHVSWIYEAILSKIIKNYKFYSDEFSKYLNSYYNQFGEPRDKGQRGIISRPTTDQIFDYFYMINKRVVNFLEKNPISDEVRRLVIMGFHHECQHQELLIYDLQHLLANRFQLFRKNSPPVSFPIENNSVKVKGGLYSMGYHGTEYCYDIELPQHQAYLDDYKIDSFPITNGQYLEFIDDGGYEDYKYWLSDGWQEVKNNNWKAPMYWIKENGKWFTRDFLGKRKINPKEPVCHVSFYEADAYSKWSGKRLPTEVEWEKAACWNEEKQIKTIFPWGDNPPTDNYANLMESYIWKCSEIGSYPEGKSSSGCHQLIGDVWEWTSSEFVGYPGFKSGFSEYNDKWFTNQKVLRGGSFGTPMMSIRGSYRNFFRLHERWLISGFRCAEDV